MIDKQSFVMLIEAQSPTCYHVARSILQNDEDCKDAMQEAVLKAWASRHKLRDKALFNTWVTRILINECRNMQRKGKKYVLGSDVALTEGEAAFPHSTTWSALDALPDKLRVPLVLHHIEGYSLQEVSKLLHLPQSTIRGRLYQARKEMRLELEDELGVDNHDL